MLVDDSLGYIVNEVGIQGSQMKEEEEEARYEMARIR